MANEEHLKILKQGVAVWNKWREDNPDMEPDLSGADLSEAKLTKADLNETNLNEANLRKAKLSYADLSKADLMKADLSEAKLTMADLLGADLHGAKLYKANLLHVKLFGANLHRANLSEANLSRANLQGAKFKAAIVDGGTRVSECEVDEDTDFSLVGLGDMRIDSGTRQLLEYNIRKKRWDAWCYQQPPWKGWLVRAFWWSSDYGKSTGRIIRSFFVLAMIFAIIYYAWGAVDYHFKCIDDNPGIVKNLFVVTGEKHSVAWCEAPIRAMYFSVVTMTTLGFGDMYAKATSNNGDWYATFRCGIGHLFLMIQVLMGYTLLGALVTRFSILFSAGGPAGEFVPMDKETKAKLDEIKNDKAKRASKTPEQE